MHSKRQPKHLIRSSLRRGYQCAVCDGKLGHLRASLLYLKIITRDRTALFFNFQKTLQCLIVFYIYCEKRGNTYNAQNENASSKKRLLNKKIEPRRIWTIGQTIPKWLTFFFNEKEYFLPSWIFHLTLDLLFE